MTLIWKQTFIKVWMQLSKEILRRMYGEVWNILVSRIECSTIRLINVDCYMKERVIYGSRMWKADNVWLFQEYGEVKDLACRGFINQYCLGDKMNECKRKEYSKKHGQAPSDDMMPTGQTMAKSREWGGNSVWSGWCPSWTWLLGKVNNWADRVYPVSNRCYTTLCLISSTYVNRNTSTTRTDFWRSRFYRDQRIQVQPQW